MADIRFVGPSKSAGWQLDDGILRLHCACGHRAHGKDTCAVGIVVRDEHKACDCPRTCPRCLNMGWYSVRRGDQNVPVDCYCPLGGVAS